MPIGEIALNPNTPYFIYEYSVAGRIFYVGITWSDTRAYKRWSHVRNLVRHEDAGTLKPAKATDLGRKSNRVIAALIRAGMKEHDVCKSWHGVGRAAAEQAEPRRIRELALSGCMLANEEYNPRPASLQEILLYLGVPGQGQQQLG
jgi:hypothetical protein